MIPDNYHSFVVSRVKWLDSPAADLMHAAVGIMGEVIELEQAIELDHLIEEAGDICFYIEALKEVIRRSGWLQPPLSSWSMLPMSGTAESMRHASGEILDLAKKYWVYNKPLGEIEQRLLANRLSRLMWAVSAFATLHQLSVDEIQVANTAKLLKRYPTGYTDQAAQLRADKEPNNG